jgi:hypothetical protein
LALPGADFLHERFKLNIPGALVWFLTFACPAAAGGLLGGIFSLVGRFLGARFSLRTRKSNNAILVGALTALAATALLVFFG